jgi:opacity protein-like surface antigen
MKKTLTLAAALLAITLPLAAQDWSVGAGSGAFIFGDFVERRLRPTTGETPAGEGVTLTLSAATRAGLAVDVEHGFAPRWAVRLEGTFTSAPLSVKEKGTTGVTPVGAGDMDVTTVMLPLVFRINPRGALRFHIMGGPAYAMYRVQGRANASGISPFDETRSEWGFAAGAGAAWWLSDRFAVEGKAVDISTSSPFHRDDFPDVPGFNIVRPHNVHTTLGVRWKF